MRYLTCSSLGGPRGRHFTDVGTKVWREAQPGSLCFLTLLRCEHSLFLGLHRPFTFFCL